MAIKVSGLISGLDTDSLVQELVSAYATKKDKYVKAQTKLEWTMDTWKTVNSKVYSFYTGSLYSSRFSTNYNLKSTSISDSKIATVTASSSAPTATQSLSVSKLATSGYLTGGKVSGNGNATEDSKLSELGISDGTIAINGTDIELTSDMTVAQLIADMKSAGVSASFDTNSQRFFVSSSTSGTDNEFLMTAENAGGLSALQSLGLFSTTDVDGNETAEMAYYRKIAGGSFDSSEEINSRYEASKWTIESYTENVQGLFEEATKNKTALQETQDSLTEQLNELKAADYDWTGKYDSEEDYNKAVSELEQKISDNNTKLAEYQSTIDTNQALLDDSTALEAKVNELNNDILANITSAVANESSIAASIVAQVDAGTLQGSSDSARITAQDAQIKLNGASFTSNTNSFSVNGLVINVTATTTSTDSAGNVTDNPVTISTAVDTQGIYDKIVSFFDEYNELVTYMDGLYYADSANGYEPLTDEEKEEMTDKQIEQWEDKVKAALLRNDTTISGITSAMKTAILSSSYTTENGDKYSLSTLGIATLSYFSATEETRGTFHIDHNPKDTATSSNEDKLMAAIARDPEGVIGFFQNLANNVNDVLNKKMSGSSLSSALTIYNDKEMSSQYSDYTDTISDWEDRLKDYEDYYYSKFTAMETALSKLQSQTSALASLLGG